MTARKIPPLLLALAFLAGCQSLGPANLTRDRDSRRTVMFLLMFTALVESVTVPQGPLLTIPAR